MQLKDLFYWYFFGILFLQFSSSFSQSSPESLYYVGAVVEYHPIEGLSEAAATSNVDNYIKILKKAKELNSNLDIIVYPETGILAESENEFFASIEEKRNRFLSLAPKFPDISEKLIPCETKDVSEILKKLSCAARMYNTYLVVNYIEKEDCEECQSGDKKYLYNSNIVFDRNGAVISRYRKYNLFQEFSFNVTQHPDISIFDTDFGVKFGQFICFDILFKTPALELLKTTEIKDIVYPTHWFAELPFLDALSIQAAWSHTNDVNFLASGYNKPITGSTGSGIYAGRSSKIPATFHANRNKNALLIANVPKVIDGKRNFDSFDKISYEFTNSEVATIVDETIQSSYLTDFLSSFNTIVIQPETDRFITLCKDNFCCHFNHKAEHNKSITDEEYYRYRFGVFSGVRPYGVINAGVDVCGLIICRNDSLSSCGKQIDEKNEIKFRTIFEKFQITAILPKKENVSLLNLPISLQTDYTPLDAENFSFQSIDIANFQILSLNLNGGGNNLMTLGIYSRNFSSDGNQLTTIETPKSWFTFN